MIDPSLILLTICDLKREAVELRELVKRQSQQIAELTEQLKEAQGDARPRDP